MIFSRKKIWSAGQKANLSRDYENGKATSKIKIHKDQPSLHYIKKEGPGESDENSSKSSSGGKK